MKYKVPFVKPHFPSADTIAEEYRQIVDSNWFTNFGPKEKQFTSAIEEYIGGGVSVATVANATLGLDLAVRALFDKDSSARHVIIPSFTFAAGPEILISNGFTPVLIDIDADTLQPSLEDARHYIEQNQQDVAGIFLCNSFGVGCSQIGDWEDLADKFGLPMIIDSAAGLGSRYFSNEKIGSRGDCEVFSMHATKPFCVGEGGLVVSKNKNLIEQVRALQNFGFSANKEIEYIGTNAKLQEINCAVGLKQLDDFDNRLESRQACLKRYKSGLDGSGFSFQSNDELSSVPFATVLCSSSDEAERALSRLNKESVEARKYYQPVHYSDTVMQESAIASSLDVTEDVYSRVVSLPVHDGMSQEVIDRITRLMVEESART